MFTVTNKQIQDIALPKLDSFSDELAERLLFVRPEHFIGLGAEACHQRVRRLTQTGYKLGLRSAAALCLFIEFSLDDATAARAALEKARVDAHDEEDIVRRFAAARRRAERLS